MACSDHDSERSTAGDQGSEKACAAYEPNDGPSQATALNSGLAIAARVCDGDQDWYAVDLEEDDLLTVRLEFRHSEGDLDLYLFDEQLRDVARSQSSDDHEFIQLRVERSGRFYLQILGYEDGQAEYGLLVLRNSEVGTCEEDPREDNDTISEAKPLEQTRMVTGRVCTGDDDLFAIEVPPGGDLVLTLSFVHAGGDLDLQLLSSSGQPLAESTTATDNEFIRARIEQGGAVIARIWGYEGASNSYTLSYAIEGATPTGEHTISGQVTFEDPIFDRQLGTYNEAREQPLPRAVIEVLNADTQEIVGGGITDLQGQYMASYDGSGVERVMLRVLAQARGGFAIDVVDDRRQVYAVTLTDGLVSPDQMRHQTSVVIIPSEGGLADPFNTLEAAQRGFVWWNTQLGFHVEP
ncbi:MAG: PPC domain-containing protein, partial [Myxococcota bacterium]